MDPWNTQRKQGSGPNFGLRPGVTFEVVVAYATDSIQAVTGQKAVRGNAIAFRGRLCNNNRLELMLPLGLRLI